MTRQEIMILSHRELDALVAKDIEGLPVVWGHDPYRVPDRRLTDRHPWIKGSVNGLRYDWVPVKRYSTDWNAVRSVLDTMHRLGWQLHLWSNTANGDVSHDGIVYLADFTRLSDKDWTKLPKHAMHGEDAPLVVVRAALWRMEESVGSRQ